MTEVAFAIAGRRIGPGEPVYVIAELSANHGQQLDRARELVRMAADAGADAIKLQTYTPDTITLVSDKPWFRIQSGSLWDGRTLYDLYGEAFTPWEWHAELKALAESLGMALFTSPFDGTAVEFLESIDVPAYKIASFELVDLPLIRRVAATGKPMILSTGMATRDEIDEAVQTAREAGARQLALLKCTSAYPAPPEEANLRTIPELAEAFGCVAGLSDHTLGTGVPIAAVALGASIVEKHVTMRREDGGPDGAFSLEPAELREMIAAIRFTEAALGEVAFGPTSRETGSRQFRRSLFVVADVGEGEVFTAANVRSIRPSNGLHTRHLDEVLGRRATRAIERGTPLDWDLVGLPEADG